MGPTVRIRDSLPSNFLASRCSPGRASEEPRGAKVFSRKANPGSPASPLVGSHRVRDIEVNSLRILFFGANILAY